MQTSYSWVDALRNCSFSTYCTTSSPGVDSCEMLRARPSDTNADTCQGIFVPWYYMYISRAQHSSAAKCVRNANATVLISAVYTGEIKAVYNRLLAAAPHDLIVVYGLVPPDPTAGHDSAWR